MLTAGAALVLALVAAGGARPAGPMGRYVVRFPERVSALGAAALADECVRAAPNGSVGLVRHRFGRAFSGLCAELSDEAVAYFLAEGAEVLVDLPVHAAATASWGLDRIDQPALPLDFTCARRARAAIAAAARPLTAPRRLAAGTRATTAAPA